MARRLAVIALVAATLFGACGSSSTRDSSTADGKKYVAALVADYTKNNSDKTFTKSQITCFAAKIVDAVGVDTMKKNGVTPTNAAGSKGLEALGSKLSSDKVKKVSDAFFGGDCFDAATVLAHSFATELKGVPSSAPKCLADALVKVDGFRLSTAKEMVGQGDSQSRTAFPGVSDATTRSIAKKCKIPASQFNL